MATQLPTIVPVLPSANIERDLAWYNEKTGFKTLFVHDMYAGIRRKHLTIHLQGHADTYNDPLLGGSVIKIFVPNIKLLFEEFVKRGTINNNKLRLNTPWNTHEFGFYDTNNNAIFFVEDID